MLQKSCQFDDFFKSEFDFISGSDAPANNSKGSPAKSASPDEGGASSSNSSESPVAPAPAKAEKTVDNWEDADNSANTPATTPEEEENSISDET